MKTLIVGLILLTSFSVFADSFEEKVTTKANAVFGLMKCDADITANGIATCEDEIRGALDSGIQATFIVDLINERGLHLPDKINNKLTNWFWVKAAASFEKI
jgi:hypothetical protein